MIITISGVPGSGKTSAGKILAEKLGMKFYSMGGLRGKMAAERGLTIDEWNAVGENDPNTDASVDEYQKKLGTTEDHFVIEGRLSWFFIPQSFKILLLCDTHEAAQRLFEAKRAQKDQPDEPEYSTIEEAKRAIVERIGSDHARYKKYYGIENYLDPAHYDLVIDTSINPGPEITAQTILRALHLA